MPAALRGKRRGGAISARNHDRCLSKWDYLAANEVSFLPISNTIMSSAIELVRDSKIKARLRSLDCIQFATFLYFQRRFSNSILFTADHSLCLLAVEHSVRYFNPLSR